VAECRLPFSFNVVPKLPATQGKRKRAQVEQEWDIPTPEPRAVRRQIDGPDVTAPVHPLGNEQIHHPAPDIDHQDALEVVQPSEEGEWSAPTMVPPPVSPQNASSTSAPLDAIKPPTQPIAPPRTDGESAPILTNVNPCSGPITGGAEVWLLGMDFPALFPLFARFGTAVVPTVSSLIAFCEALSHRPSQVFRNPYLLTCQLPSAAAPGVVDVTLSKHPRANAPGYGTSLAKFQYLRDQDQL